MNYTLAELLVELLIHASHADIHFDLQNRIIALEASVANLTVTVGNNETSTAAAHDRIDEVVKDPIAP